MPKEDNQYNKAGFTTDKSMKMIYKIEFGIAEHI